MKDFIVIPTYNERDNITHLVPIIFSVVPGINILVVDDSSPDETGQAVQDLKKKYPNLSLLSRREKTGLGAAYIEGFKHLLQNPEVRRLIMMDADFSHDPKYLKDLLGKSENYDLVIGSRYIKGGGIEKWELWRRLLSRGANFYLRLIFNKPVRDWTGGYVCISAKTLAKINFSAIELSGYAFISELKYLLLAAGARAFETPIIFMARRGGESKISGFIMREALWAPWKLRWRFARNPEIFFWSQKKF